jgi:hypothetical protein
MTGKRGNRNKEGYKELKMRDCGSWSLIEFQRAAKP